MQKHDAHLTRTPIVSAILADEDGYGYTSHQRVREF